MILSFSEVIRPEEHERLLELIDRETFVPGRETAGERIAERKNNEQFARDSGQLEAVTNIVLDALKRNTPFCEAFYPRQLHSVLVSRYRPGMAYGPHVDSALMGQETAWRSDLSLTLFLSEPDAYDGGELALESGSGEVRIKLPARSLVCYPTSQLHQVREVTQGERLAVVGWIQSFVREPQAREALYDLARARDDIHSTMGASRAYDLVNKAHTNLLRRWAEN